MVKQVFEEFKIESSTSMLIDTLRLIRSENVGLMTFYDLIKVYKTPGKALHIIPELARNGGRKKPIKVCSLQDAELEIEQTLNYGANIISIFDNNYPVLLSNINDPPPIISFKGNLAFNYNKNIAIVGSRNASADGCRIAYKLARTIGEAGFTVTSGFARGINNAVHKGSLLTGTIAILAGGINDIYPIESKELYQQIYDQGVIVSEFPFGLSAKKQNSSCYNRIVSGMSIATLVVEASIKSSALIIAKYAVEQNRKLFSVPGFPLESRYQGNNSLLKQGAILVESVDDILEVLNNYQNQENFCEINTFDKNKYQYSSEHISDTELARTREILLSKLSYVPVSIDDIINLCDLNYRAAMIVMLEFELAGKLLRYPNNKFSLIFDSN